MKRVKIGKCKIRVPYGRNSCTPTRGICFYIYILIIDYEKCCEHNTSQLCLVFL